MSFRRRSTSEGILDVVSEQTKHTGIPFLCYEEILLCPFVLEYATLAINRSLLQHSHLKLDTLERKEQILCAKTVSYSSVYSKSARSRHYYLAKSARPRHYYLVSDRLITNGMNDRQICIANHIHNNLTLFMTFGFRR